MALTDSIQIPINLKLEPLNPTEMKVITDSIGELGKRLQQQMSAQRGLNLGDFAIPSATGTSQFESKGKMYEISGRIRADVQKLEDGAIEQVDRIAFNIKEVKDRILQDITEEAKRLKEFKTTLKHQPTAVKIEKIKKYLGEFDDVNNELTHRQEVLTKNLEKQNFADVRATLSNLGLEEQVLGYRRLERTAVHTKQAVRHELKKANEAVRNKLEQNKKKYYNQVTEQIQDLDPQEQIAALDKYMTNKYANVRRATHDKKIIIDKLNKLSFSDMKFQAKLAGPDGAEKIFEDYIAKGGAFSKQAQREILLNREKLKGKSYRDYRTESRELPIGQRAALWQEYLNGDGFFKKQAQRNIDKDIKALSAKTWRDTKKQASSASTLEEKPDVFKKYMDENPASEFMKEAQITYTKSVDAVDKAIAKDAEKRAKVIKDAAIKESNAFKKSLKEASMLPADQQEGAYQAIETANRGKRFEKEATFRLHKNQKSTEYQRYSELLKDASNLPFDERMVLWRKYIEDGGMFKIQAERNIKRASSQYDKTSFNKIVRDSKAFDLKDQTAYIGSNMAAHAASGGGIMAAEQMNQFAKIKARLAGVGWKEAKLEALEKLPADQIAFLEAFKRGAPAFAKEADRAINKAKRQLSKQDWQDTKYSILQQPIEDQGTLFRSFGARNAEWAKATARESNKAENKLEAINWKKAKNEASLMKLPEHQERFLQTFRAGAGSFKGEVDHEIAKVQARMKGIDWKDTRLDILNKPLTDQAALFTAFGATNPLFAKEVAREQKKLTDKINKLDWKTVKSGSTTKSLDDYQTDVTDYLTRRGAFATDAFRELAKINKKKASKAFQDVKLKTTGMTDIDAAIAEWEAYITAAGTDATAIAKGQAEIRKLVPKGTSSKATTSRKIYSKWAKSIGALDPNTAIAQIDAALSSGNYGGGGGAIPPEFIDDIKGMRRRVDKTVVSKIRQDQRDRHKQFANNVLIGAGAGLGLLGPVGFPLLNIGFAAMSGGPIGAGIAAVSTALGEATRAINAHTEANKAAAREVGAIPNALKSVEAKGKGYDAIFGAVALSSEAVGEKKRLEMWKQAQLTGEGTRWWADVWQTGKSFGTNIISKSMAGGNLTKVGRAVDFDSLSSTWDKQRASSLEDKITNARSAYDNMLMMVNKPSVGIETDPYQTWLRIQQNAFDPSKALERKWQEDMLKYAKETLDAIIAGTPPLPPPTPLTIP